jgi:hypothetical protein
MRMFRGYFLVSTIFALAAPAIAVIDRVTERIATFVLSLFAPAPRRLAADGPSFERRIDRAGYEPSLLESLRHEKGVPRYGAARSI